MKYLLFVPLLISVTISSAYAEKENSVEVFTAPKSKNVKTPTFPNKAAKRAAEGWVVFSFMVDVDGKVFEPTVIESTGGKYAREFEKAAKSALIRTSYQPALDSGNPVEGASTMKYVFSMKSGANGASKPFAREYSEYSNVLASGHQQAAETALKQLEAKGVRNLYENAYLNMGRFNFANKYGSTDEQMKYLKTALSYENHGPKVTFLPDDILIIARRKIFELQLTNLHYAEAIESYLSFSKNGDKEATELFNPAYQQLLELQSNQDAYEVAAVTNENGRWSIDLLKQGFSVSKVDGLLNEIKMRCDKKYIYFSYEKDKEYSIPESWGECNVEVLGSSDVNFNLLQF